MARFFRRWKGWRRWLRPFAIGAGSIMDLSGQSTLRAAQRLTPDPFDLRSDPPERVDMISSADAWPPATRCRRHVYADGRVRCWLSRRGGPWIEEEQEWPRS